MGDPTAFPSIPLLHSKTKTDLTCRTHSPSPSPSFSSSAMVRWCAAPPRMALHSSASPSPQPHHGESPPPTSLCTVDLLLVCRRPPPSVPPPRAPPPRAPLASLLLARCLLILLPDASSSTCTGYLSARNWRLDGSSLELSWTATGGGHGAMARALPSERLGQPMAGSGRGAHRLIVAEINWNLTTWLGRNR